MSWVGALLATVGALLCLTSAVAMVRLFSALGRVSIVAKASTLGLTFVLAGSVIMHPTLGFTIEAVLVVAFLWLVTPVSAHLVGRAAYQTGDVGPLSYDEFADRERFSRERNASVSELGSEAER